MTMDDPFYEIVSDVHITEPDKEEVLDVSTLSTSELLDMFYHLNLELFEHGQALKPTTQEARDKHSLRNAIQVELASRKSEL